MANMLAPENRSKLMSLIRGRGNQTTELRLAQGMRATGIRGWRRHLGLPGRPDFTFPHERLCIFVHGCFWHGCPHCYRKPATNASFWARKVSGNRRRDRRAVRNLRLAGYRTLTIWECSLRGAGLPRQLARVRRALSGPHRAVRRGNERQRE